MMAQLRMAVAVAVAMLVALPVFAVALGLGDVAALPVVAVALGLEVVVTAKESWDSTASSQIQIRPQRVPFLEFLK